RVVVLEEAVEVARGAHQGLPLLLGPRREVEREVQVDVDEAGDALGALDVAPDPVDRVGGAAQHFCTCCSLPAARRSVPSSAWTGGGSGSTQVSLLPPPWEELTTSDPFLSATRVSPPGCT